MHAIPGRVLALLVSSLIGLQACQAVPSASPPAAPAAPPTAAPISRANVNFRLPASFSPPAPYQSLNDPASLIARGLYDTLVVYDSQSKKVVPYLAESFEQTVDSVTFKIRKGPTCSDGTPITPTVVADSFKWMVDPELAFTRLLAAFGAGPYSVSSDDTAGTVTFKTGVPNGELLFAFADVWTGGIICPAGLRKPELEFMTTSYGSGPYVIDSVTSGDSMVVKRRPEWNWGPNGQTANDPGFPDTITFKVVANDTTAANLLLSGEIDVAQIQSTDARRLSASPSIVTTALKSTVSTPVIIFNHFPTSPTSDIKLREAIATAIDPKAWDQAANDGLGEVVTGYFGPLHRCSDPSTASLLPNPAGNLDKARSILVAAGYTLTPDAKIQKDGKQVTVVLIASPGTGNGPDYVQEQLNKLGLNAVLNKTDDATHRNNMRGGMYDLFFRPDGAVISPVAGPLPPLLSGADPPASANNSRTHDVILDDLWAKARADTTCDGWKAWQKQLLSQFHVFPLSASITNWFTRQGVNYAGDVSVLSIRRTK
jgi:peptide/nickel transport system substrate-binding protein